MNHIFQNISQIKNVFPPWISQLIILESHYHCLSQTSINHDQFNEQKRLIESFVYSEQTQPFRHLFHHHRLKINWNWSEAGFFSILKYSKNVERCRPHMEIMFIWVINVTLSFFLARTLKHCRFTFVTSGIDSNHSMIPAMCTHQKFKVFAWWNDPAKHFKICHILYVRN